MARLSGQNGESCRDLGTAPDCGARERGAKSQRRPHPCGGAGGAGAGGGGEPAPVAGERLEVRDWDRRSSGRQGFAGR